MWHLLGEVEVVFGFWAMVLVFVIAALQGTAAPRLRRLAQLHRADVRVRDHGDGRQPAVLHVARRWCAHRAAAAAAAADRHVLPALSLVPLLGSLITEPAAMTLAALMLREQIFRRRYPTPKYATLGVLFVNISIGGMLTPFAAPPVLMVAETGAGTSAHVTHFGWKAALAVLVNAAGVTFVFRRESGAPPPRRRDRDRPPCSRWWSAIHLLLLAGVVAFAHHPPVFLGLLLFFLGFTKPIAVPGPRDAARRPAGGVLPGRVGGAGRTAAMVAGSAAARHGCRCRSSTAPRR